MGQSIAVAGAAAAAPFVVPSSALGLDGSTAPSERIVLGAIGLGFFWEFPIDYGYKESQLVALCDVNGQRLEAGKQLVDKHYGNGDCKTYKDFREVVARKDIDAVYIATPDHWHALVTIAAAKAGKDIYCQKPMTHTRGGRPRGGRCGQPLRRGLSARHATALGMVVLVRRRVGPQRADRKTPDGPPGRAQRPKLPAAAGRARPRVARLGYVARSRAAGAFLRGSLFAGPHSWYFISDYCVGYIAGWGIHHLDSAMQGLGDDFGGVFEVDGRAVFPKDGLYDTPLTWRVEYTFPSGVKIIDTDVTQQPMGVRYQGTEGSVFCWRGNVLGDRSEIGAQARRSCRKRFIVTKAPITCKIGSIASAPANARPPRWKSPINRPRFAISARFRCCWAGSCAGIPAAEKFLDDDEANRFLSKPMREPWTI